MLIVFINYFIMNFQPALNIPIMIIIGGITFLIYWNLCGYWNDINEHQERLTKSVLIAILVTYIYFIIAVTLINRRNTEAPEANLIPLWSWYQVIVNHSLWFLEEIVLNIILFIPLGALLRLTINTSVRNAFLIGFGFSLIIEVLEFVLCRGLFEWDDILHNALGCMIGALIFNIVCNNHCEDDESLDCINDDAGAHCHLFGRKSMSPLLYGIMTIYSERFLYCYNNKLEEITLYINKQSKELEGLSQVIGREIGNPKSEDILYKLSVPLSFKQENVIGQIGNNELIINLKCPVDYYIENYHENTTYTSMELQFPELDYLLPSCSRVKIQDKDVICSKGTETVYSFDVEYMETQITVSFNIKGETTGEVKTTIETVSEVLFTFPGTQNIDFIIGLYDRARSFFSFVCNRENIGLYSAKIIGTFPLEIMKNGESMKKACKAEQTIFFSHKDFDPLEDDKIVSKTINLKLLSDRLQELFQLFFESEIESIPKVDAFAVHPSYNRMKVIDLDQSLKITSTFEHYVETLLPEIPSEETKKFIDDLKAFLDYYITKSTGKKKKKAKSYKKSLEPRISLEEKINKVYEGYSNWGSLDSILLDWFDSDIPKLALSVNAWRNDLAHGNREIIPDKDTINAVRLVEHINYCIVFRTAGYDDDCIKKILSMILLDKGV